MLKNGWKSEISYSQRQVNRNTENTERGYMKRGTTSHAEIENVCVGDLTKFDQIGEYNGTTCISENVIQRPLLCISYIWY